MSANDLVHSKITNLLKTLNTLSKDHGLTFWSEEKNINNYEKGYYAVGMLEEHVNKLDNLITATPTLTPTTMFFQTPSNDSFLKCQKYAYLKDLYSSVGEVSDELTHNGVSLRITIHKTSIELSPSLFTNETFNGEAILVPTAELIEKLSIQLNEDSLVPAIIPNNANPKVIEKYNKVYDLKIKLWFSNAAKNWDGSLDSLHQSAGYSYISIEDWTAFMDICCKNFDLTNKDLRVFEAGSGTGAVINYILNKNSSIYIEGNDICENAIEKCQKVFPHVPLKVEDLNTMEIVDSKIETFDAMISVGVLSYMDTLDDLAKVIRRLMKLVKKGGKFAGCLFTEVPEGLKSFKILVPKSWWNLFIESGEAENLEIVQLPDDSHFPHRYCVYFTKK